MNVVLHISFEMNEIHVQFEYLIAYIHRLPGCAVHVSKITQDLGLLPTTQVT